ncbi:uroporphyrinogen decarboxylase [Peptococcaceae bacterium CEB3]|nr:uroporphyrinogen decarboxylase [Peptococcaceae bacterium CEB3]
MALPKERMERVFAGLRPDRIPFVPTIYEHAAALLGKTPSDLARNEELLVDGQLAAYERYRHDLVVVGLDIYNVEAEALGCQVDFYTSTDIPGVVKHVLAEDSGKLLKLTPPDPEVSARMPLIIGAAMKVREKIGTEVNVGGAMVGPFTLAAMLRGFEQFIFDLVLEPDFAGSLLDFTTAVGIRFGGALVREGLGAAINESWIAQPLLSPDLYREFVLPRHKKLIEEIKDQGPGFVSLISGGDTTAIADDLVRTGSAILMADYNTDQLLFKQKAQEARVVLRASLDSKLMELGTEEQIEEQALRVLRTCAPGGRFIMGCGVVSYQTDPARILRLKKVVQEFQEF